MKVLPTSVKLVFVYKIFIVKPFFYYSLYILRYIFYFQLIKLSAEQYNSNNISQRKISALSILSIIGSTAVYVIRICLVDFNVFIDSRVSLSIIIEFVD